MDGKRIYDVLIIGGGPGGYTAALYAVRAGLTAAVLEKLSAGGQMAQTQQVDNYPGFEEGADGFDLAEKMQRQAERFGAVTEYAEVTSVNLLSEPKKAETTEGDFYGRTVIISTGANPGKLGIPDEEKLTGRGVAYCAACEGMFYKGKRVVVVGGGNSAAADAMLLSRIAEKVTVVHRRDTLRASKVYHEPLMKNENVEFKWNSEVTELISDKKLTAVKTRNNLTGETEEINCDGLFISIGRKPESSLFRGQTEIDEAGYIVADETTATNIPGVFAAGDIRTKPLRQIVTATADGAVAADMAERYLAGNIENKRGPEVM